MKKLFAMLFSVCFLACALTPMALAETGEDPAGTLFFEFEDLAQAAGAGNIQTEESHEDALSVEYASGKAYWATIRTETDPSATLTVTVPLGQAGYYKVQYAAMNCKPDTTNLSNMTFTVNGTVVGDNENACTLLEELTVYEPAVDDNGDPVLNQDGTQKQNQIYPWGYAKMALFEGTEVCYLNEGENTLRVDVSYCDKAQYGKWKFFADYIKFIPETGALIAAEGTCIEAEDMTSENVVDVTGASGGKWIGTTDIKVAGDDAKTIAPIKTLVTFSESRYYDLTYVATRWQKSVSEVAVYLNDEKIGSNKDDKEIGIDVQERFTSAASGDAADWTAQWNHMYAYAKEVWVDAGTYPLEIKILPCEDPSWTEVAKYFVDYITLQPTADEVTKDSENNYTAKVCFSSPVSGVALMAAYNGNELAAVSSTLLSEATQYVETTLNTDKSVTHVKVFVWDGTENCIPQAACKELLVSE